MHGIAHTVRLEKKIGHTQTHKCLSFALRRGLLILTSDQNRRPRKGAGSSSIRTPTSQGFFFPTHHPVRISSFHTRSRPLGSSPRAAPLTHALPAHGPATHATPTRCTLGTPHTARLNTRPSRSRTIGPALRLGPGPALTTLHAARAKHYWPRAATETRGVAPQALPGPMVRIQGGPEPCTIGRSSGLYPGCGSAARTWLGPRIRFPGGTGGGDYIKEITPQSQPQPASRPR